MVCDEVTVNMHDILAQVEFEEFREVPSFVAEALRRAPENPIGYLRAAQASASLLKADESIADIARRPGAAYVAIMGYPDDARGFLKRAKDTAHAMQKELEFCRRPLDEIYFAAVQCPSSPRKFLRSWLLRNRLLRDSEFVRQRIVGWMVAAALKQRPEKARQCLQERLACIAEILREPEFHRYAAHPGAVRWAVFAHPDDPRSFLRGLRG